MQPRGSEINVRRLTEAGVQFVHGDIRQPSDLSDLSGQFVQPLLAARHQHQSVAVARKDAREFRADARRCAGDERNRRHALPLWFATRWRKAIRSVDDTPSRSATRQIRLSSYSETAPSA